MNKTLTVIGVIIVVLLVIFGLKSNTTSADTIKVGVIAPLTGTAAVYGEEGKNAVVLAFEEINAAGGINGKKVEVVVEDGKCEATAALSAWNKLVNSDKVVAVFGGHCSTETLTLAPLSAKAEVPLLAVFTTAPSIPNEGSWVFRHISTNAFLGEKLAEQAVKKGYKKVALLTEQKDFPLTYSEAFIAAFKAKGGTVVLDERFAPTTKDYRTSVLKLKGTNPDAIFISTQGPDVMGIVYGQVKEAGFDKPILLNHAFAPGKFLEGSKNQLPSEYLILTPYADVNAPKTKTFVDAYTSRYGKPFKFSTFFVTADYDIAYRFKVAAEKCPEISGACVADQMKLQRSYSGAAGDVSIDEDFKVSTKISTVRVIDANTQVFEEVK